MVTAEEGWMGVEDVAGRWLWLQLWLWRWLRPCQHRLSQACPSPVTPTPHLLANPLSSQGAAGGGGGEVSGGQVCIGGQAG